ncbi:alanyl-tRNA synthetase [Calycina marina]|uniref:Alanyl-tRNA synthetase n=1 Tax=Calycina marina TaxID=1763456 RepID=A0A9P7Z0D0_9HELO|nr:alanyl-tRNA synthetase [Calycina marina]
MASVARTYMAFQHNAKLHTLETIVIVIRSFATLEEANRLLFKEGKDDDHVVVTGKTIFHPQGGGQPSDVGKMTSPSGVSFNVAMVRMDTLNDGQVLHFGRFTSGDSVFKGGESIEQAIDMEKRLYFSRLHTAGHILGAAVRHLLEKEIEGFDELKASHFPDSASCEFQGSIEGKWKDPIQKKVDEYIAAKLPVEIEFWNEEEFKKTWPGTADSRSNFVAPGEKLRVVNIVGAEVYPCGGTHVDTSDLCGETKVKKISRSKGTSRVSYTVAS